MGPKIGVSTRTVPSDQSSSPSVRRMHRNLQSRTLLQCRGRTVWWFGPKIGGIIAYRLLVISLLLHSAVAQPVHLEPATPLEIINGYPFVRVWVNHHGPLRMMIDTGASSCSLAPRAARACGLTFDHRVTLTTALGGEKIVPATGTAKVQCGPSEIGNVEILVTDLAGLSYVDPSADGVLGQSFLNKIPYLIDYRASRLWLNTEATAEGLGFSRKIESEQASGRTVVTARIDPGHERWKLVLDSGASELILYCAKRQCQGSASVAGDDRLIANGSAKTAKRYLLDRVVLSDLTVSKVQAAFIDTDGPEGEDGILPLRLFSAVYVDWMRNLVRVRD